MLSEVKKQTLTLMSAAFGFVAALVWKDAIVEWFKPITESMEGAVGLTLVALIVTVVVVILTMVLTKMFGGEEK